jgi:peptidoglycan/LPS O-acetylase OafA/YrhL
MNTAASHRSRPTREQGLAIAARRKAARRRRTARIRRSVAVLAVAAFVGPFAVIYTQLADGHDPALAANNAVAATADASGSTRDSGSGAATTTTSQPAPLTTQQS